MCLQKGIKTLLLEAINPQKKNTTMRVESAPVLVGCFVWLITLVSLVVYQAIVAENTKKWLKNSFSKHNKTRLVMLRQNCKLTSNITLQC